MVLDHSYISHSRNNLFNFLEKDVEIALWGVERKEILRVWKLPFLEILSKKPGENHRES